MLRIHFTADDLARTTVAASADPLWEVLLSGFRLRDRDRPLEFRPWTQRVRDDRARAAQLRPGLRLLSALTPPGAYIPDFLTPDEAKDGLDAGLEAVARTPRRRLHHELGRLAARTAVPDWVRPLADGDLTYLARLTAELRARHATTMAPYQSLIGRSVDADRALRANRLLGNGIDGLFDSLRPLAHWRPPVLEVDYVVDQDLYLNGRGLRLVPSFFSRHQADSLASPDLAPVLVYPIDHDSRWTLARTIDGRQSLEALIGVTRAAVLYAVDPGATTTQLAHRLGTSLASVSRHTTVLRDAGLIATHRDGRAVCHTLTPLGRALLEGHQ